MKRSWIPFIILFLLTGIVTQVFAVDMVGSKAFGMGGAFTAVADDASSLYWNPAGLTRSGIIGGEVSVGVQAGSLDEFVTLTEGLIFGTKGHAESIQGKVTAFIGANLSSYSGALIREETIGFNGLNGYTDSQMVGNIAFARQSKILGRTSLGVNLKMLQRTYTTYTDSGRHDLNLTGQGFAVDLGVLWPVAGFLTLGATVKNLGPDLILTDRNYSMTFLPEQKASIGAAVHVADVTLAADLEHNVRNNEDIVRAGVEDKILFGLIALRCGAETSLTHHVGFTLTGGIGLHLAAIGLDVGVASKDYFTNDLNGLISLSLKF